MEALNDLVSSPLIARASGAVAGLASELRGLRAEMTLLEVQTEMASGSPDRLLAGLRAGLAGVFAGAWRASELHGDALRASGGACAETERLCSALLDLAPREETLLAENRRRRAARGHLRRAWAARALGTADSASDSAPLVRKAFLDALPPEPSKLPAVLRLLRDGDVVVVSSALMWCLDTWYACKASKPEKREDAAAAPSPKNLESEDLFGEVEEAFGATPRVEAPTAEGAPATPITCTDFILKLPATLALELCGRLPSLEERGACAGMEVLTRYAEARFRVGSTDACYVGITSAAKALCEHACVDVAAAALAACVTLEVPAGEWTLWGPQLALRARGAAREAALWRTLTRLYEQGDAAFRAALEESPALWRLAPGEPRAPRMARLAALARVCRCGNGDPPASARCARLLSALFALLRSPLADAGVVTAIAGIARRHAARLPGTPGAQKTHDDAVVAQLTSALLKHLDGPLGEHVAGALRSLFSGGGDGSRLSACLELLQSVREGAGASHGTPVAGTGGAGLASQAAPSAGLAAAHDQTTLTLLHLVIDQWTLAPARIAEAVATAVRPLVDAWRARALASPGQRAVLRACFHLLLLRVCASGHPHEAAHAALRSAAVTCAATSDDPAVAGRGRLLASLEGLPSGPLEPLTKLGPEEARTAALQLPGDARTRASYALLLALCRGRTAGEAPAEPSPRDLFAAVPRLPGVRPLRDLPGVAEEARVVPMVAQVTPATATPGVTLKVSAGAELDAFYADFTDTAVREPAPTTATTPASDDAHGRVQPGEAEESD